MHHLSHKTLTEGENNFWYEFNDSDDVIVFVHGFFSESSRCWLYNNKANPSENLFWPDLIRQDSRFGNPSQFLGGYASALDSENYGFRNCADELFTALNRPDELGHPPVMDKGSIVFVCHSMGGIIVRRILQRNWEKFQEKRVGLVLIASPSYGAAHADRLKWLAELYNQRQAMHLGWGDALLEDLDADFRNLVDSRKIPKLIGVEAVESRFVIHNKWLPFFSRTLAVNEESAGRYFGAAKMLRGTDHFNAVKPNGMNHPAHELLVDFWQRYDGQHQASNALTEHKTLSETAPASSEVVSKQISVNPPIIVNPIQNQTVRINWPSEKKDT